MRIHPRSVTAAFVALSLALSGCASREGALKPRNIEKTPIDASSAQITAAAEKAFAAHGFYPVPDSTPQEIVLKKKTPLLFRQIKGGDATVWLVLEPRVAGWEIYCVAESDGVYPGGSTRRFLSVLAEIKRSAEAQR